MSLKCLYPFLVLQFHRDGEVYFCCPAWTKFGPIGNLFESSVLEIWNGARAQLFRQKFFEGKIDEVCNERICSVVKDGKVINFKKMAKWGPEYKRLIPILQKKITNLPFLPLTLDLADNGECNLRCRMCMSNSTFIPTNNQLSKMIFKKALPKLLPGLKYISLTGNGEPFFRKETREFMQNFDPQKYPHLEINLLTNGLLLNRKMWETIKHCNFSVISVSIEAATKKTYQKIRGGDWQTLQKNLKFISQLRKKRKFKNFMINFVVMRSNYREMKDFVKMGLFLDCDKIRFLKIFGITPNCWEENINLFKDSNVFLEIKEILKDPIFKKRQVLVGQLKSYKNYQRNFWDELGLYKLKKLILIPLFRVYFWVPVNDRRKMIVILRKILPPALRTKIVA